MRTEQPRAESRKSNDKAFALFAHAAALPDKLTEDPNMIGLDHLLIESHRFFISAEYDVLNV
jgi:hypothetical protein